MKATPIELSESVFSQYPVGYVPAHYVWTDFTDRFGWIKLDGLDRTLDGYAFLKVERTFDFYDANAGYSAGTVQSFVNRRYVGALYLEAAYATKKDYSDHVLIHVRFNRENPWVPVPEHAEKTFAIPMRHFPEWDRIDVLENFAYQVLQDLIEEYG